MKIFSISNQKGGVGKTTTTVNLSAAVATMDKKILLVDMDPQGNASSGCGLEKHKLGLSVNEVLMGRCKITQAIVTPEAGKFDVLPSDASLTQAELALVSADQRERRLRLALEQIPQGTYDLVFIDTPPTLNLLTLNALTAAQGLIIPVQCEYYSLEGLSALMKTIDIVNSSHNPNLEISAIVRTMYDKRSRLSRDVSNQLLKYFSGKVMSTIIPRNVRLAEAPSYGMSAIEYDMNASGSIAYMALASELFNKHIL